MNNDIKRTPSDGSDGSIRKRISSLITGNINKPDVPKPIQTPSITIAPSLEIEEDPLPDTKQELEARLNFHLAELDQLKRTITAATDTIREHAGRYEILQARTSSSMRHCMHMQEAMVVQAKANRDSWCQFVRFHRRQIERIKNRRIEIEMNAGLEPTLPQVYKQMWTDDDWARLFLAC